MKKAVTLKDIAVKLNMSVSTVSKALNKDKSISLATRLRVKKQANEWNYIPNEAARHFKINKTFTVGLIIPNMLDQYYVLAINGAEKVAAMEKYNVIISQSHEDPSNEKKIVDLMMRNRVDGLIVAITKDTTDMSAFKKLENIGIPVVFIARPPKDDSFDYVTSNNEDGAKKATNYIIKQGHTRIGHLKGPKSLAVSLSRLKGYKEALKKSNIGFDEDLVKEIDFTIESTIKAVKELLALDQPPTAIFAFKNYINLDAMKFLRSEFPKEAVKMVFTGFGNLPIFHYLDHKPIASIEENSYEMGEAAARLVFEMIKSDKPTLQSKGIHIQIPCKLIIHK